MKPDIRAIYEIFHFILPLGDEYCFPREENRRLGSGVLTNEEIPTLDEIKMILKRAEEHAKLSASELGILNHDIETVVIRQTTELIVDINDEDSDIEPTVVENVENEMPNVINDDEDDDQDHSKNDEIEFLSSLDLKSFTSHQVKDNKSYLKIGEKNIKKSTLVWFFSHKKGRLSTDRLLRVKGMSSNKSIIRKTINRNTNKTKRSTDTGSNSKRRKIETRNYSDSSSQEEIDSIHLESEIEYESAESDEEKTETQTNITKESVMLNEHYYSVYFDEDWFIGRIIEKIDENKFVVKFLEKNFDKFVWPKREDIQEINRHFIFYGPIQLEGNDPFSVKRPDLLRIKNKYKSLKKDFRS